jgi:heterodisulfide reductase subunit A-like polyferredoxin
LDLKGKVGHFNARVLQKPRYIDLSKCTACGECAKVCPVELSNEYDEGLSNRKAAHKLYAQAIPSAYAIQKTDKAPCSLACPAGLNVQGYVQMVGQGKYEEALKIIMEDLPLPGVLGRICPHGCEDACRRCEVDNPVAIRDLKRLAADQFDPRNIKIECLPPREEKVAIVGSGPAGLSAAYHLARKGVLSTIFESLPEAGGMLRVGIPDHRLPREILDREIELITNLGVEIKVNIPLGTQLTVDDLFKEGYKAVYLAIGAHKGIELGIPGEKAKGVRQGVDFLRELNLTGKTSVGKKLGVIGGGNVAIDVSRSAVRLGAEEVNIIYRRTRAEMPAWEEEIHAAEAEGVKITYLAAPQEVLIHDGKIVGIRCIRMELGETDSSGRRRPVPIPGSEYEIEIDQLIPAIGQRPDLSALEDMKGLTFSRWGTVEADPITYATKREGVFAGGDLQTGPWVAIGAIAAGREAAESIVRYLDGRDMAEGREPITLENPAYRPIPEDEAKKDRAEMPELPVKDRKGNFKEVELGYDEDRGKEEAHRCLNCGYCCECFQCVEACTAEAVIHNEKPTEREIEVGSAILCGGANVFDPAPYEDLYHYKSYPNVVTSMEFERFLSATGPTTGHLFRPSDNKEPTTIAWIQCVGSRDTGRCSNSYCSSVCCMYAIKEALIAKEHIGGNFTGTIFNMDIRSHGKGFERYYERAKSEGIRFIRSRVHSITEADDTGTLKIHYVEESGDIYEEEFDIVVLSVGMEPDTSSIELARNLGVDLNGNNFVDTDDFSPVMTSRPGIYVAGVLQGTKDIPQSVTEASAAACASAVSLAQSRGKETREKIFPEEKDVISEEPRIGVFVCNCGTNIGGFADVPGIAEYAKTLPNVVNVDENLFTCSQDTQEKIVEVIKEHKLNRIVVAACTPTTHEPLFRETIRNAGLNENLFEMANIRNQCTWVHSHNKEEATEKSKDLVRMAVAKSSLLEPISDQMVDIEKSGLIIGGGVAGMTAALSLADQGFQSTIVERSDKLGGAAREIKKTWRGKDVQEYLSVLIKRIEQHPMVEVILNAEVTGSSGFVGNFETDIITGKKTKTIKHGVCIIATGANASSPDEYLYGKNPRVTRWHDLEQDPARIKDAKTVVFILCVGSRDEKRPYCSRICCTSSIGQAVNFKEENPDINVFVLYRDIRTYGEKEALYQEARNKGIIFIRYTLDKKPVVSESDDGLDIRVFDHVLQRELLIKADLLNLATAIEPAGHEDIAGYFKLPVDDDNFFIEAHAKLRPVDFANEGLFLCGMAHYPKPIDESIVQAMAAASKAAIILSRPSIKVSPLVSQVDPERCIGCGLCAEVCNFGAIIMEEIEGIGFRAKNVPASCKGCGLCASSCPQGAIDMLHFRDRQLLAAVSAVK